MFIRICNLVESNKNKFKILPKAKFSHPQIKIPGKKMKKIKKKKKIIQTPKTKNIVVDYLSNYKPKNYHILNNIQPFNDPDNHEGGSSESESFEKSKNMLPLRVCRNIIPK